MMRVVLLVVAGGSEEENVDELTGVRESRDEVEVDGRMSLTRNEKEMNFGRKGRKEDPGGKG